MALTEVATVVSAADTMVKIPSGVMSMLRQSYDSREKVLDWMLAFAVVGALLYAFWPKLSGYAAKNITPDEDVSEALPDLWTQAAPSKLYTYNLPAARPTTFNRGPNSTRVPTDPGQTNNYQEAP